MKFLPWIVILILSIGPLHADFASDTLTQINIVRQKAGLGPLSLDSDLMTFSQEWANRLAAEQALTHRSMSGVREAIQRFGLHGMDENLHRSTAPATPSFVVECWMNSPIHHENLLRPKLTKAGIGVKEGTDGLTYVVFNGAF